MKFSESKTVGQIAELLSAEVEGDSSLTLEGLDSLETATETDLSFASDDTHLAGLGESRAIAALVPADTPPQPGKALLRVADVQAALAMLLGELAGKEDLPPTGVHPSAVVDETAQLGEDVAIGPNVTVGPNVRIGNRTVLCAGVVLGSNVEIGDDCILFESAVIRKDCSLGHRVRVGSNTVIGFEGFGYYCENGIHHRIPHAGNVVIEDDVDLGACICIDRAKWGSTRIGAGSKVDNLVQIAHNVQVGPGNIIVAQAGIAGSAKLGAYVVLGGGAGVRDNIELADQTQVAAHSALAQSVSEPNQQLAGTPARDTKVVFRELVSVAKLPDLIKQVRTLEKRMKNIESATND